MLGTLPVTDSAEPTEVYSMAIRVAWDRTPVSIHGSKEELLMLIEHLRNNHSYRKHSIVMPDRENDEEAVFFLYSPCDPRWIAEVM